MDSVVKKKKEMTQGKQILKAVRPLYRGLEILNLTTTKIEQVMWDAGIRKGDGGRLSYTQIAQVLLDDGLPSINMIKNIKKRIGAAIPTSKPLTTEQLFQRIIRVAESRGIDAAVAYIIGGEMKKDNTKGGEILFATASKMVSSTSTKEVKDEGIAVQH